METNEMKMMQDIVKLLLEKMHFQRELQEPSWVGVLVIFLVN